MTDPNSFVMLVSAEQLLAPATEFVRSQLKASGMDASHDWDHVLRVKNMAKKLAAEEGLDASTIAGESWSTVKSYWSVQSSMSKHAPGECCRES
eukprot:1161774-Pelagomonas_calceolata.AAC.6